MFVRQDQCKRAAVIVFNRRPRQLACEIPTHSNGFLFRTTFLSSVVANPLKAVVGWPHYMASLKIEIPPRFKSLSIFSHSTIDTIAYNVGTFLVFSSIAILWYIVLTVYKPELPFPDSSSSSSVKTLTASPQNSQFIRIQLLNSLNYRIA